MFHQKISIPIIILAALACGKKKVDGTSGQAKLEMSKKTSLALASPTTYTPSKYSVKFLNAYIVPDVTSSFDNLGVPSMIWVNPDCTLTDSTSEIDGKNYPYKVMGGDCVDENVNTYFELARAAADVNADLNSQNLAVLPGTYNYVKLDVCINGAKTDTIKFQADGMSAVHGATNGTCGVTSAKAATPIVVGEGESITVSLSYDLTGLVYDYGIGMNKESNCYFNADSTVRRCVNFPTLTLSATKQ